MPHHLTTPCRNSLRSILAPRNPRNTQYQLLEIADFAVAGNVLARCRPIRVGSGEPAVEFRSGVVTVMYFSQHYLIPYVVPVHHWRGKDAQS